jgi:putative membrane protein
MLAPEAADRIVAAVRDAEKGTSGEIVPCIVAASDDYPEAIWIAAATGTAIAGVLVQALHWLWPDLFLVSLAMQATLPIAFGAVVAAVVALAPPLRRLVVGRRRRSDRVRERALRSFVECGVFRTRDRTGVLLFVSLFEHEVLVLGDEGIAAKVTDEDWRSVVDHVAEGLRTGNLEGGLLRGIADVGTLLRREGFLARPDDRNELRDHPVAPRSDTPWPDSR